MFVRRKVSRRKTLRLRPSAQSGLPIRADRSLAAFPLCSSAMNTNQPYLRSPELMSAEDTVLVVVDVQVKLMPLIRGQARILWNLRRLIDGAEATGVQDAGHRAVSPGPGPDRPRTGRPTGRRSPARRPLAAAAANRSWPNSSSPASARCWSPASKPTSACSKPCSTCWPAAIGCTSRSTRSARVTQIDYETGLRRMESAGATLTTTESALFEWCQVSGTPTFKKISALVREAAAGRLVRPGSSRLCRRVGLDPRSINQR